MGKDEIMSKTISGLRFPLTAGVVFMHFNLAKNGLSIHGIEYGVNHPTWYGHFHHFFCYALPSIIVPLFFFISGFLFFYGKDFDSKLYIKKLKTRARTLLVPFILWNVIAFLNMAWRMLPCLSPVFPNAYKTEFKFSLLRMFNTLFYNNRYNSVLVPPMDESVDVATILPAPMDVPMWYVRDLMLMVLLSPVIYWLLKKGGIWYVIVVGIISSFLILPDGYYWVFLSTALFFFSWGAYYSVHKKSFVDSMRGYWYMPLLFLCLAVVDAWPKNTESLHLYIHSMSQFAGVISAIVVMSYLVENGKVKINSILAGGSFFVYALHMLILTDIGKILVIVFHLPDDTYVMLACSFIVPAITYSICMGLYVLLNRYLPRVCNLLTGGR